MRQTQSTGKSETPGAHPGDKMEISGLSKGPTTLGLKACAIGLLLRTHGLMMSETIPSPLLHSKTRLPTLFLNF